MLQALLHGKLAGELRRDPFEIEDLLTAVVFGSCRYSPMERGLLPFLSLSVDQDGTRLGATLAGAVSVEYEFWPPWSRVEATEESRRDGDRQIREPSPVPVSETEIPETLRVDTTQGASGGEPEVLLRIQLGDGTEGWLLVEAKLNSGKSSHASEAGDVTDQLGKYWVQLRTRAMQAGALPLGVVYVTKSIAFPRDEFLNTQAELKRKGHAMAPLFWLSWRRFADAVRGHESQDPLLRDVVTLLADMWGLVYRPMSPWPRVPVQLPPRPRFGLDWPAYSKQPPIWAFRGA